MFSSSGSKSYPLVIRIENGPNNGLNGSVSTSLHLLPCTVQCTCDVEEDRDCTHPAKVDKYFDPVIRSNGTKEDRDLGYSATFRGRPLQGALMEVPGGYTGQVLSDSHQKDKDITLEGARVFEVEGHFNKFYYWNLQNHPTTDDKLLKALQYSRLAKVIHKAVSTDDS